MSEGFSNSRAGETTPLQAAAPKLCSVGVRCAAVSPTHQHSSNDSVHSSNSR